jgi:putative FmdB family regulatory protein
MPIYEYRCRKCKETFEVMQKVNEENRGLRCPKCETDEPERLLSAFCSGSPKGNTTTRAPGHSSPGHS